MLFLVCLLLLSFSATSYSSTANAVLISLRIILVLALSVLTIREKYRNRGSTNPPDSSDPVLRKWRHWFYGEQEKSGG